MGLNLLINFLKFLKFTTPFMTFVFLGTWFCRFNDEDTFKALDFLLGFLPRKFDRIIHVDMIVGDKTITMGYVFSSILMSVICIIAIKLLNIFEKYKKLTVGEPLNNEALYFEMLQMKQKSALNNKGQNTNQGNQDANQNSNRGANKNLNQDLNQDLKQNSNQGASQDINNYNQNEPKTHSNIEAKENNTINQNYQNQIQTQNNLKNSNANLSNDTLNQSTAQIQTLKDEQIESESLINTFYTLFEFDIKYLGEDEQSEESLKNIKIEFTKIVVNKLKEKYSTAKFVVKDRMIIIFKDFNMSTQIMKDVTNLYKVISSTAQKLSIKADFLMSFHASKQSATPKEVTTTLVMINKLKHINQIIASGVFYSKYMKENPEFDKFESIGTTEFKKIAQDGSNINMDLFKIKV